MQTRAISLQGFANIRVSWIFKRLAWSRPIIFCSAKTRRFSRFKIRETVLGFVRNRSGRSPASNMVSLLSGLNLTLWTFRKVLPSPGWPASAFVVTFSSVESALRRSLIKVGYLKSRRGGDSSEKDWESLAWSISISDTSDETNDGGKRFNDTMLRFLFYTATPLYHYRRMKN